MEIKTSYTINDIKRILNIGQTKAYEMVNSQSQQGKNGFPVVRIGRTIRVPVEPFQEWLLRGKIS